MGSLVLVTEESFILEQEASVRMKIRRTSLDFRIEVIVMGKLRVLGDTCYRQRNAAKQNRNCDGLGLMGFKDED